MLPVPSSPVVVPVASELTQCAPFFETLVKCDVSVIQGVVGGVNPVVVEETALSVHVQVLSFLQALIAISETTANKTIFFILLSFNLLI